MYLEMSLAVSQVLYVVGSPVMWFPVAYQLGVEVHRNLSVAEC